ncbi:Uncharacterised protein [Starkeya nomas]|uniref:Phage tail assembly protein n=2 Tax=Starkeya nomas TaxID=2666134 RepID=A0A5S9R3L8_9HYPH|nr:Uncharacterised protein [Starkeya nomas]
MELSGEVLPPPIDKEPTLTPVRPPPGSPNDPNRTGGADASPAEAESRPIAAAAVGDFAFVDPDKRETVVPLEHPFTLDGVRYDAIRVRRLTTAEVSAVIGNGARNIDLFDAYAAMTGLPAAVLRQRMDGEDGLAVTGACSRFLPRLLKEMFGFK